MTRLFDALDRPPRSHYPVALWWWSGEPVTRERLRWQLERFAAGGLFHLVVINLAPSGPLFGADPDEPAFFSEPWWALLDQVCEDAAALGVRLWFYDQLGFSGADIQARLVERRPEHAGRWLDRIRVDVDGPGEVRAPAGARPVAATVQRSGRDPEAVPVDSDGVRWTGTGTLTLYYDYPRGFDYLSAPACAELLDQVHGEFARRLPHRLGRVLVGSFQDELPALPTWSAAFAAEFAARRGYDPVPLLDSLWAGGGPDGYRFRRDYHLTRAELAEEAFFRPLAEWHDKHGLLSGCDQQDPARAGRPVGGVRLYADYPRTHRWFSAPGSDHHGDARLHSSLAHLYCHPRTWIESFHSSGWGGTLEETFDWLLPWLRAGANLYNPHAVYYSTRGGWFEWAPPSTDWRQPYWPHYRVFADAVARLCAALSMGRHVCDIAVLLPTATVQAGTSLDGADEAAQRAEQTYLELVGDMTWFRTEPGVLDRLCRDADVIDDESVAVATVDDGRLRVAGEAYAAVVLPACAVLPAATARRLADFAAAGGRVVAVGVRPSLGADGLQAEAAVAELAALVSFVDRADEVGAVLSDLPAPVVAPVPPLVREVDGASVVFLTAAFPRASRVGVGHPEQRGIELGWLDAEYDFDPGRYRREMPVRVSGLGRRAVLVDPFTGARRELAVAGDGTLTVPFDHGPAALLVFPRDSAPGPAPAAPPPVREVDLGDRWEMTLVPTVDNTWGDFAQPPGELPAVQRWELRHRVGDDGEWAPAHATFGPHARWAGPADPELLPGPGEAGALPWREAVYSTSRGIHKDPVHRRTLGPKGHVPEEFLAFGTVPAGQAVHLQSDLVVPAPTEGTLLIGAAAAKSAWLDGAPLDLTDRGYLAHAPVRLPPGRHRLDLRLQPDEAVDLRAYLTVMDGTDWLRPEWLTAAGPPQPGAALTFGTRFTWPAASTLLQVASAAGLSVRVNGDLVGRQGGFEPYAEQDTPRVRRYDLTGLARDGENELTLTLTEPEEAVAVLVDGVVASGPGWWARRGEEPAPVRVRRGQYLDPASLHLPRRPHPLPGSAAAVWAAPDHRSGRVEWLACTLPPGARRVTLTVRGTVTVLIDGAEVVHVKDGGPVSVDLDPPEPRGPRECLLRLETEPGYGGGAALAGPIEVDTGPGLIALGDWERYGLDGYSGGVRYRQRVEVDGDGDAVLDLGRVRGTAEVTVNGAPSGVRVCAPYAVPVRLRAGSNDIEVLVYGTLAPYLDAVSPTHYVFPGQRVSGLFGPVRLAIG